MQIGKHILVVKQAHRRRIFTLSAVLLVSLLVLCVVLVRGCQSRNPDPSTQPSTAAPTVPPTTAPTVPPTLAPTAPPTEAPLKAGWQVEKVYTYPMGTQCEKGWLFTAPNGWLSAQFVKLLEVTDSANIDWYHQALHRDMTREELAQEGQWLLPLLDVADSIK